MRDAQAAAPEILVDDKWPPEIVGLPSTAGTLWANVRWWLATGAAG